MQPINRTPGTLISSLIVGLIVGVLVGVICYLLGSIEHLTFLRTYDFPIGAVAGIVTFLQRWQGWTL